MDYPLEICLEGAEGRIGKKREYMPWIESEFDEEFRQYIIDFPKDNLPVIYNLLNKYQNDDKTIVIFKSRKEADDYLETIISSMKCI